MIEWKDINEELPNTEKVVDVLTFFSSLYPVQTACFNSHLAVRVNDGARTINPQDEIGFYIYNMQILTKKEEGYCVGDDIRITHWAYINKPERKIKKLLTKTGN